MADAVSSNSISVTLELKEEDKDGPTQPCERGERSHSPTGSLRTLRPRQCFVGGQSSTRSPDPRDFSRWHECCRPFLLETIQRRTEQDIQSLARRSDDLQGYILQQLAERHCRDSHDLSFLDLRPALRFDVHLRRKGPRSRVNMDAKSISRSSTSSQTSVNSMSSQVSDSFLNDVQQSAEVLLQSLRLGIAEVASLERGAGMLSRVQQLIRHPSALANQNKVEALRNAIKKTESIINQCQPDMYTIGFPDVGLKLNAREQTFRETVLKYLQTVKREKKIKRLRKMLNRPEEWKHWHEDYPSLTSTTTDMADEIQRALKSAIETRDAYLKAAYKDINEVTQTYAKRCGVQVQDEYDGMVLVQRTFRESELAAGSHFLCSYWPK